MQRLQGPHDLAVTKPAIRQASLPEKQPVADSVNTPALEGLQSHAVAAKVLTLVSHLPMTCHGGCTSQDLFICPLYTGLPVSTM